MEKKLPGVFPGKVKKDAGNNTKTFYSNQKETKEGNPKTKQQKKPKIEKNINQKLSEIFNSPNYVYKIDVEITLKDKKVTKKIIGKNHNNLITIENELIPISDIIDIKQKQD